MNLVYVLLVAHFVGDFICQSDWMALNKSKRWDALLSHVAVYYAVLNVAVWAAGFGVLSDPGAASFCVVNFAAHFVQDAITSRITSRLWFVDGVRTVSTRISAGEWKDAFAQTYDVAYNDKRHWFFVAIGADQLLHYITLSVTANLWLR